MWSIVFLASISIFAVWRQFGYTVICFIAFFWAMANVLIIHFVSKQASVQVEALNEKITADDFNLTDAPHIEAEIGFKVAKYTEYGDGFSFVVFDEVQAYKSAYIFRVRANSVMVTHNQSSWLIQVYI